MSLGALMRLTPTYVPLFLNAPVPTTNQAAGRSRFCYHQTMTIGITGPERRAPRRNAVVGIIVAAIVVGIFLILLGLTGDVLVDWLWFSSIGYLQVFLTTFGTKAVVFFSVLVATAIVLLLNGFLAANFARRQWTQHPAAWQRPGMATLPNPFGFMRHRLSWPRVIASGAGLLAILVAAGEV